MIKKYLWLVILMILLAVIAGLWLAQININKDEDISLEDDFRIYMILGKIKQIETVSSLLQADIPLTFALNPNFFHAHELAEDIWYTGKDVVIEIPDNIYYKSVLKDAEKFKLELSKYLQIIPFATGIVFSDKILLSLLKDKKVLQSSLEFIHNKRLTIIIPKKYLKHIISELTEGDKKSCYIYNNYVPEKTPLPKIIYRNIQKNNKRNICLYMDAKYSKVFFEKILPSMTFDNFAIIPSL